MKKFILFLSVFMITLATLLVGCAKDKYGDLKITVTSVISSDGDRLSPNEEDGFYYVEVGQTFTISCDVSSSTPITKYLNFVSENSSVLHFEKTAENSRSAVFTANAYTVDEPVGIKISSKETLTNAITLNFMIVAPVTEITTPDNLVLDSKNPLNIKENVVFKSSYLQNNSLQVNNSEKKLTYTLNSIIVNNQTYSLVLRDDNWYDIIGFDGATVFPNGKENAFTIQNDTLIVADDVYGNLLLDVKSYRYVENIEETFDDSLTEIDKNNLIQANNKLINKNVSINILQPLKITDFTISSGQISFENIGQDGLEKIKLTSILYDNRSTDSYNVSGTNYNYNLETLNIFISNLDKDFYTIKFFDIDGNQIKENSTGVLKLSENNPTQLNANKVGTEYVDIVVSYNTANNISYSFSELYKEYLQDNGLQLEDNLNILQFNVQSLANNIELYIDDSLTSVDSNGEVEIFDKYAETKNLGTKFEIKFSNITGVDKENKKVKVYLESSNVLDLTKYLEIYDASNGSTISRITIESEVTDGKTYYYFIRDLDLNQSVFYMKATDADILNSFNIRVENLLQTNILDRNNESILNNLTNAEDSFSIVVKKGVSIVEAKIVNGQNFYNIATNKDAGQDENELFYSKLVLDLSNNSTLVALMFDYGLEGELNLSSYNSSAIKIEKVDNANIYFSENATASNLSISAVYKITGLKEITNSRVTFTADNGYSISFIVDVVKQVKQVNYNFYEYYDGSITQNLYDEENYVSIKKDQSFNFNFIPSTLNVTESASSGIINYSYSVENEEIAYVADNSIGKITAISEGISTVSLYVEYYSFNLVNGYNQWTKIAFTESFDLEVFVPAKDINVNQNTITSFNYNDLPSEYSSNSQIQISVNIDNNATISNLERYADKISFRFKDQENFLNTVKENNEIIANTVLKSDQESLVTYVYVTVDEFGIEHNFECKIEITRPVKINEIDLRIIDGFNKQVKIDETNNNVDGTIRVGKDEILNAITLINPENPLIDEFVVTIYDELIIPDGADYDIIEFNSKNDNLRFNFNADEQIAGEDGIFYVIVNAKDSLEIFYDSDNQPYYEFTKSYVLRVIIEDGIKNSYGISNQEELIAINQDPSKNYILENDIVLSGDFTPIQNFTGVFNGNGFTISNLNISSTSAHLMDDINQTYNVGLFASLNNKADTYGVIYDLNLQVNNINLTSNINALQVNVGGLVGNNNGLIINSSVNIKNIYVNLPNAQVNVGGLVGLNTNNIFNFAFDSLYNYETDADLISKEFVILNNSKINNLILGNTLSDSSIENAISKKYVKGNIAVYDSLASSANIGGIVGRNDFVVNGFYGLYARYTSTNNNYIVTYQSQYVDSDVLINVNNGELVNENSTVGGIAGLNNKNLFNLSSQGKIGNFDFNTNTLASSTYKNVGGIVGSTLGNIQNVLSSVYVRGQENIGGIAGKVVGSSSLETVLNKSKVESYDCSNDLSNTIIVGKNNVGGIAGFSSYGYLTESYFYGYSDKFDTSYINNGDIFVVNQDGNEYAGGLIGFAEQSSINNSFAIANIKSIVDSLNIRGLSGSSVKAGNDVFYFGVVNISGKNDVENILGALSCDYYFVFDYNDSFDNFVLVKSYGDTTNDIENANITFEYLDGDNLVSIYKYSDILRDMPVDIVVSGNGSGVENANNEIVLEFKTGDIKNNFYAYQISQGEEIVNVLLVNLIEKNSIMNIGDLFNISSTPNSISLNLIVESSNNKIVSVNDDGSLTFKNYGEVILTFTVKENLLVSSQVKVIINESFDNLMLSSNHNFANSYFDSTESNVSKVRTGFEFNIISQLSKNVGGTTFEIENANFYDIDFNISYKSDANGTYSEAVLGRDYEIVNQYNNVLVAKFIVNGYFKFDVSISFQDEDGNIYRIKDNSWVFYLLSFSGAVDISFAESEIWIKTNETYESLTVNLGVDNGAERPELTIQLQLPSNEKIILNATVADEVYTFNHNNSPFIITVSNLNNSIENVYSYNLSISVKQEFEKIDEAQEYFLVVYDKAELLIDDGAGVQINLIPALLEKIDLVHYAYTQKSSTLINNTNTSIDGNEESTYFYSYSQNSSDMIYAGMGGLLVIQLYPYYSDIISVNIKSSLNGTGGDISFIQLAKVRDANKNSSGGYDEYFVVAPSPIKNLDGSYSLNLVSSMPNTRIVFDGNNNASLEGDGKYAFNEEPNYPNYGMLFVRTIAPTDLSKNDSFTITVSVTYSSINDNKQIVETTKVESKTLEVKDIPGMSMTLSHNGVERNVIAYTGSNGESASQPDWIDITTQVDSGINSTISYTYLSKNDGNVQGSDYVNIVQKDSNNYELRLGSKAVVGDIITLTMEVQLIYDDRIVIQKASTQTITVVDVVIESLSLYGINENNQLILGVSSAMQIRAKINGFGLQSAIESVEQEISRSVYNSSGSALYWFAKDEDSQNYITLNSQNIADKLPFNVKQLPNSIDGNFEVSVNGITYVLNYNTIYLEGMINSGSASLLLNCSYEYRNAELYLIPNYSSETAFSNSFYFDVLIVKGEGDENLTAIENETDFKTKMYEGGDYILMNDITLTNYVPIEANFSSFDGNNKIITINSFYYNVQQTGKDKQINLGLFSTVSDQTTIKNVIVALPDDKNSNNNYPYMDLSTYTSITYGGIASINNGLITNSEVITIDKIKDNSTNVGYSFNIKTSPTATVNVGLVVGINNGIITNSRVGRETVQVLQSLDNDSAIVNLKNLDSVLDNTAIYVNGAGNVAGFVAVNNGTISSSYAKNIQLETFIDEGGHENLKTAGFVIENNGYIYGSYASGWEENTRDAVVSDTSLIIDSENRKLGGGIFTNSTIAGFVHQNNNYIEDSYSNINISGSYVFAAKTSKILNENSQNTTGFISSAGGAGFVYKASEKSYITTSYSLSKIKADNTLGLFAGNLNYSSEDDNELGTMSDCYALKEIGESFVVYDVDGVTVLYDQSESSVEGDYNTDINQFADENSFNNFSFDTNVEDFSSFDGISSGGVWAMYRGENNSAYPELISANTIAISCRVINFDKDGNEYYTYVDGYDYGSINNPYLISNASEYNDLFSDYNYGEGFNQNIASKFTKSIRLINHINFANLPVYSTSVEYTSIVGEETTIFDGNYLSMYNIFLSDSNEVKDSFGLFRNVYNAGIKNLSLGISSIIAGNTTSVGALAGVIVDSNISNISLFACSTTTDVNGEIRGNNYVGALAGIITSSDNGEFYFVSRIKSNLLVKGSTSDTGISSSIKNSFDIWEDIKPITVASGTSYIGGNLRLNELNKSNYYAGGIAGVIDLRQRQELSETVIISDYNVSNIHVGAFYQNTSVNTTSNSYGDVGVMSVYAGGLFGYIGEETFLTKSQFIVSQNSSISAKEIAGGIAGVNFGMISKSYVSYNPKTMRVIDSDFINYVNGANYVSQPNTSLFSKDIENYQPKYIGGIVGLNSGDDTTGSGSIIDCYNRVDVKNPYSLGVGGIVGASYIGEISNVYTTASLYGNFELRKLSNGTTVEADDVYVGAIIGKIMKDSENYFSSSITAEQKELNLFNIVAVNLWDINDFESIFNFVNTKDGYVGALYGFYENGADSTGIVRISQSSNIYVQNYILNGYTNHYLSTIDSSEDFNKYDYNSYETSGKTTYIQLWGSAYETRTEGSTAPTPSDDPDNIDDYLSQYFSQNKDARIEPHDFRITFKDNVIETGTISASARILKETYFNELNWLPVTWDHSIVNLLPLLSYGYMSSIIEIRTAEDFFTELSAKDNGDKTFIVMNDIDFSDYPSIEPIMQEFNGTLLGMDISYEINGIRYTRKPILFNLNLVNDAVDKSGYAIFNNAVNATFADLNFVINNYDVQFTKDDATTQAGILVASAESTTFRNINIYNSLIDEAVIQSLSTTNLSGTYLVGMGIQYENLVAVGYSPKSFLVTSDNYGNTYNYEYSTNENVYNLVKEIIVEGSSTADKVILVTSENNIKTNASIFGAIVGNVNGEVNVENSSSNIDVEVTYDKYKNTVYVGGLIGKGTGSIIKSIVQSNFLVKSSYQITGGINRHVDTIYLGGIAGSFQGKMEDIYSTNSTFVLGTSSEDLIVSNNTSNSYSDVGVYVGGIVGKFAEYRTSSNSTIGTAENIYISDISISLYVSGHVTVGTFVGKNQGIVTNVFVRQSKNPKVLNSGLATNTDIIKNVISLKLDSLSSNYYIGGVIGEATSANISSVYSNIAIQISMIKFNNLAIGGIIGQLSTTAILTDVVSDSEIINIERLENYSSSSLYAGGIVGRATNSLSLDGVISTTNIKTSQEERMYIGGLVGYAYSVSLKDCITLGDIQLNRGMGDSSDSYFYKGAIQDNESGISVGAYYIGGAVGIIENTFSVVSDSSLNKGVLVGTSIKDYAIAQKINVNISSALGGQLSDAIFAGSLDKVYYNENLSLVSNYNLKNSTQNSNNEKDGKRAFTAVNQNYLEKIFFDIIDTFSIKSSNFVTYVDVLKYDSNYKSNLFENLVFYSVEKVTSGSSTQENVILTLFDGSKLKPYNFTDSTNLKSNKYYILTQEVVINSPIVTSETNWFINAQGFSINLSNPNQAVFDTITENSALVGMILVVNIKNVNRSNYATIANNNYGFVFACSVGGEVSISKTYGNSSTFINSNYGVINKCLSAVNISTMSGVGFVFYNGKSTNSSYIGNIYDCSFTGSVNSLAGSSSSNKFSGFVFETDYGVISNSYTMADIQNANSSNIYPMVVSSQKSGKNFYRAFYDYVAYLGNNDTVSIKDVVGEEGYISSQGIYAWTTAFTGDISISQNSSNLGIKIEVISDLFNTYWIGISTKTVLVDFISRMNIENVNDLQYVDTTWFNYGYALKDYRNNVLIKDEEIDQLNIDSIVSKFFNMLYTGNGLSYDQDLEDETNILKTVTFIDMPYMIKHGGILESFVIENSNSEHVRYRFYKFVKDIDLRKYQDVTYWSLSWDLKNTSFVGHLDGNNKTVKNMFSTNGLLRVLPDSTKISLSPEVNYTTYTDEYNIVTVIRNNVVKNIVFENCISKTGLLAGYAVNSNVSAISVATGATTNYVYNGDLFDLYTKQPIAVFNTDRPDDKTLPHTIFDLDVIKNTINSIVYETIIENQVSVGSQSENVLVRESQTITFKGLNGVSGSNSSFAGGIIGYMNSGYLLLDSINGGLSVMVKQKGYIDVSAQNETDYKLDTSNSFVGGVVGILQEGYISRNTVKDYIVIDSINVSASQDKNARIQSHSYVGGVAGYVGNNATIEYIQISSDDTSSQNEQLKLILNSDYAVGGIAGLVNGGWIDYCQYNYADGDGLRLGYAYWDKNDSSGNTQANLIFNNFSSVSDNEYSYDSINLDEKIFGFEFFVGGIAGIVTKGDITNCSFTSRAMNSINIENIVGLFTIVGGGIIGDAYAYLNKISNSSNNVKDDIIIENCSFLGQFSIKGYQEIVVGGIVGRMRGGEIINCNSGKNTNSNGDQNIDVDKNSKISAHTKSIESSGGATLNILNNYFATSGSNRNLFLRILDSYATFISSSTFADFKSNRYNKVMGQINSTDNTFNFDFEKLVGMYGQGYTVAGGIIGRLINGEVGVINVNLDNQNNNDENNLQNKVTNNAVINVYGDSGGGIAGEIFVTRTDELTALANVHIKNAYNYGHVEVYGTPALSVNGEGDLDYDDCLEDLWNGEVLDGNSIFGLSLPEVSAGTNFDFAVGFESMFKFSVMMNDASAGGIVGNIVVTGTSSKDKNHVLIEDCLSGDVHVGSLLATFSGGIVGISSGEYSKLNNSVIVQNCNSSSTNRGFILRSFAGGIVGYLKNTTVKYCTYESRMMDTLFSVIEEGDDGKSFVDNLKSTFSDFASLESYVSVPYIHGGIVGYMESGFVNTCNTELLSTILAVRIAGGIVGVAGGGIIKSDSVMYNGALVITLFNGVAGGIVAVLDGAELITIGENLSISAIVKNIVTNMPDIIETCGKVDSIEDFFDAFLTVILDACNNSTDKDKMKGFMINLPTIVSGYVSGGIVGYYQSSVNTQISGMINLSSVVSSLFSYFDSSFFMGLYTKLENELKDIYNRIETGIKEDIWPKLLEVWSTVSNYVTNESFLKYILGSDYDFEAGFEIGGQKYPILDVFAGLSIKSLATLLKLVADFDIDGYSFSEYFTGIIINKYEWVNSYDSDLGGNVSQLKYQKNIRIIENEQSNSYSTDIRLNDLVEKSDSFNPEDFATTSSDAVGMMGSSGGIIGFINSKNSSTLVISSTVNYGFNLTTNWTGLDKVLDYLNTRISSSGFAGGLVGCIYDESNQVDITFSSNMAIVYGKSAGGILGYGGPNAQITSVRDEGDILVDVVVNMVAGNELYGAVSNNGEIYGTLFAGGIAGYADGLQINSQKIDNLFAPNSIGVYAEWSRTYKPGIEINPNYETIESDKIKGNWSQGIGDINFLSGIFSIVNSGTVRGTMFTGGIVGFMGGNTGIYMANVSKNVFSSIMQSFTLNFDFTFALEGVYVGGIAGYMQSGKISSTCYVGTNSKLNNLHLVSLPANQYVPSQSKIQSQTLSQSLLAIQDSRNAYLSASTSRSAQQIIDANNMFGGYAGGVVGFYVNGEVGGDYIKVKGETQTEIVGVVNVNQGVKFGLTDNAISPFSGGVIGYYNYTATERAPVYAQINSSVSNAYFVGGLMGQTKEGATLDFNMDANKNNKENQNAQDGSNIPTPYYSSISVSVANGQQSSDEDETIKGAEGSFVGGIIGYAKNCKISNIFMSGNITSEGAKNTIGGIVGLMDGGTITNAYVGRLDSNGAVYTNSEYPVIKITEEKNKDDEKVNIWQTYDDIEMINTRYALGVVGGIVGMIVSTSDNTLDTKISNVTMFGGIQGGVFSGGIVGWLGNNAVVENVTNLGSVEDALYSGGIVGRLDGGELISGYVSHNSENEHIVYGDNNKFKLVNGDTSENYKLTISGKYGAGGLVGVLSDIIVTDSKSILSGGDASSEYITLTSSLEQDDNKNNNNESEEEEETPVQEETRIGIGGIVGAMLGGEIKGNTNKDENENNSQDEDVEIKESYPKAANVQGEVVGGLVGYMEAGTINDGYVQNVTLLENGKYAGGIVGTFKGGTINKVRHKQDEEGNITAKVSATKNTYGAMGGVIGNLEIDTTLTPVYIANTITGLPVENGLYAGGLIGHANTKVAITNDNMKAKVTTISGSYYAGGIFGWVSNGTIEVSLNSNTNIESATYGGGIIGYIGRGTNDEQSSSSVIINSPTNVTEVSVPLSQYQLSINAGTIGGYVGFVDNTEVQFDNNQYIIRGTFKNCIVFGGIVGETSYSCIQSKANGLTTTSTNIEKRNVYFVIEIDSSRMNTFGGIVGYSEKSLIEGFKITFSNLSDPILPGGDNPLYSIINFVNIANDIVVGGIVATANYSTINSCESALSFSSYITSASALARVDMGGIVGFAKSSSIIDSINKVPIYSTNMKSNVGGIVGVINTGYILDCSNEGDIKLLQNIVADGENVSATLNVVKAWAMSDGSKNFVFSGTVVEEGGENDSPTTTAETNDNVSNPNDNYLFFSQNYTGGVGGIAGYAYSDIDFEGVIVEKEDEPDDEPAQIINDSQLPDGGDDSQTDNLQFVKIRAGNTGTIYGYYFYGRSETDGKYDYNKELSYIDPNDDSKSDYSYFENAFDHRGLILGYAGGDILSTDNSKITIQDTTNYQSSSGTTNYLSSYDTNDHIQLVDNTTDTGDDSGEGEDGQDSDTPGTVTINWAERHDVLTNQYSYIYELSYVVTNFTCQEESGQYVETSQLEVKKYKYVAESEETVKQLTLNSYEEFENYKTKINGILNLPDSESKNHSVHSLEFNYEEEHTSQEDYSTTSITLKVYELHRTYIAISLVDDYKQVYGFSFTGSRVANNVDTYMSELSFKANLVLINLTEKYIGEVVDDKTTLIPNKLPPEPVEEDDTGSGSGSSTTSLNLNKHNLVEKLNNITTPLKESKGLLDSTNVLNNNLFLVENQLFGKFYHF